MKWRFCVGACLALSLSACETLSDFKVGLDLLQGDASMTVQYGDGKAVVEAKQGDQKVRFVGQR